MFVRRSKYEAMVRDRDHFLKVCERRFLRLLEVEAKADRLKAELEAAASGKEWWRDEADRLNGRLVEVTAERDQIKAERDTAIEHVGQVIDQKYGLLDRLKAEVARLTEAMAAEERASNLVLIAERGQIAELNEEVATLKAALDRTQGDNLRGFRENTRLNDEVAALRAELATRSRVMHCRCGFSTFR